MEKWLGLFLYLIIIIFVCSKSGRIKLLGSYPIVEGLLLLLLKNV